MCVGEAGKTICVLCPGQATKNVVMDGSAEPCYKMGHMNHETKRNVFRLLFGNESGLQRWELDLIFNTLSFSVAFVVAVVVVIVVFLILIWHETALYIEI